MRRPLIHRISSRAHVYAVQRLLPALLSRRRVTNLVRLGTPYGGWWVPREIIGSHIVAYCAGAGTDITFDLALLEQGCRVTTFDPTPAAIQHVGGQAIDDERFRFVATGWWDRDTTLRFTGPANHLSYSAVIDRPGGGAPFVARVKPVSQLMRELGDDHVDLIKMDIEGAEYAVIASLLRDGPLPTVLCVEFDQPAPILGTLRAVARLRRAGYSLLHVESLNYTFRLSTSVPLRS